MSSTDLVHWTARPAYSHPASGGDPFFNDAPVGKLFTDAAKRVALVAERGTPLRCEFTPGQVTLRAGGTELEDQARTILAEFGQGPFIFNLGHGITPQTPIENVERMLRRVRG